MDTCESLIMLIICALVTVYSVLRACCGRRSSE